MKALAVDRQAAAKLLPDGSSRAGSSVSAAELRPHPPRCLDDGTGAQGSLGAGSAVFAPATLAAGLPPSTGTLRTAFPQHLSCSPPGRSAAKSKRCRACHSRLNASPKMRFLGSRPSGVVRHGFPSPINTAPSSIFWRTRQRAAAFATSRVASRPICVIPEADADTLIRYAEKLGNGAVFKRLGFLVSRTPGNESLAEACRQRLTEGNAKLDPALPCRRLVKAWRLWIPKNWDAGRSVIDRREILAIAANLGLLPNVVEKDYVLGWLLAGIFNHPALAEKWVFKGGTCLKKCYFETYRFSEDLDFTLTDESHLNVDFLVSNWYYLRTQLNFL